MTTMKAVRLFEHGGPSVLKYIDVDMPTIGDEDVLVKVHMTSINGICPTVPASCHLIPFLAVPIGHRHFSWGATPPEKSSKP
jgi:hypothetical protein